MSEVNFSQADLTYVDFSSDLPEVYTVLHRATFIGADLTDSNFENTLVSNAEWENAICPDGSLAADHGQTCIGHGVEAPE